MFFFRSVTMLYQNRDCSSVVGVFFFWCSPVGKVSCIAFIASSSTGSGIKKQNKTKKTSLLTHRADRSGRSASNPRVSLRARLATCTRPSPV